MPRETLTALTLVENIPGQFESDTNMGVSRALGIKGTRTEAWLPI